MPFPFHSGFRVSGFRAVWGQLSRTDVGERPSLVHQLPAQYSIWSINTAPRPSHATVMPAVQGVMLSWKGPVQLRSLVSLSFAEEVGWLVGCRWRGAGVHGGLLVGREQNLASEWLSSGHFLALCCVAYGQLFHLLKVTFLRGTMTWLLLTWEMLEGPLK